MTNSETNILFAITGAAVLVVIFSPRAAHGFWRFLLSFARVVHAHGDAMTAAYAGYWATFRAGAREADERVMDAN